MKLLINNDAISAKMADAIVGKAMTELKRVSDALWMCFGEKVQVTFDDGQNRNRSEYMIRIQCPFRITQETNIVIGSQDMHYPRAGVNEENFAWHMQDMSILDASIEHFNNGFLPIEVTNIMMDSTGSLIIQFNNDVRMESFINGCQKTVEYWRFISYSPDKTKYVLFGNE